jgi:hypothetical protein
MVVAVLSSHLETLLFVSRIQFPVGVPISWLVGGEEGEVPILLGK